MPISTANADSANVRTAITKSNPARTFAAILRRVSFDLDMMRIAQPDRRNPRAVFAFIVANPGKIPLTSWMPTIHPANSTRDPTAVTLNPAKFVRTRSRRTITNTSQY